MWRLSPGRAFVVGLAGVAFVLGVLLPFNDRVDLSVPALLVLVPIVAASVLGGWRAAVPLAVIAALGYAFGYVPPIGDIRPHVGRDVVTLATFVTVALAVGVLTQRRGRTPATDAQLLDAQRAQLLRTVGHDLRNPLHTIQAVAVGLMSSAPDEHSRSSLATVAAESQRLDRIVANLLSAGRIEAGALLPATAPEHLGALVEATVRRLGGALDRRVVVDIPDDLPDVAVDAVQFDQVLTNLLENAARHGRVDGAIEVSARHSRTEVTLVVVDDGPGFSAEQLVDPVAFRPGPGSAGTGLGLSVSRSIIEAHGGSVRLANRRSGGAEVAVTVPIVEQ